MIKSEKYSLRKRLNQDAYSISIINSENLFLNNSKSKLSPFQNSEASKIINKSNSFQANTDKHESLTIKKIRKKRITK